MSQIKRGRDTVSVEEYRNLIKRKHKYHATRVTRGGNTFDSKGEADRYDVLRWKEKTGLISQLRRQVRFLLKPVTYGHGKTIRAVYLVIDFTYNENELHVAEDFKGFMTPVAKLKLKFFQEKYPELTLRITKSFGKPKRRTR